jgi:hypothetical protein
MNKAGSPDTKAGVFLEAILFPVGNVDFLFMHNIASYIEALDRSGVWITQYNGDKVYYEDSARLRDILRYWCRCEALNGSEVCVGSKKFNIQKKIIKPVWYLGIRCLGRLLDLLGI